MGPIVVVFAGEYDVSCRAQFRRELGRLASKPALILDFSEVTYLDSTSVTELLRLNHRRAEANFERETIVVRTPLLRRLFAILQLDRVFNVVADLDDALGRRAEPAQIEYAFSGTDPTLPAPDDFEAVPAH